MPGFEFGTPTAPGSPREPSPYAAARSPGAPSPYAVPGSPRAPGPHPVPDPPQAPGQYRAPGPPRTQAGHARHGARVRHSAGAEWARLLRSVQPASGPRARRRRLAAFRAGLRFRGPGRSLIVPMLAMVVLGVAAAVLVGANRSQTGPAPAPASLGLPPATLAGGLFTAAAGRPGQPQSVDVQAVAAGADAPGLLVAAGRANGQPAAWVSADGGGTWTPAAGQDPAVLVRPGTQLTSVADGSDGWLAVGGPAAPAASAHPVVLTSADGRTWSAADRQAAFGPPGLVTEQAAAGDPAGSRDRHPVLRHRRLPAQCRASRRRRLVVRRAWPAGIAPPPRWMPARGCRP